MWQKTPSYILVWMLHKLVIAAATVVHTAHSSPTVLTSRALSLCSAVFYYSEKNTVPPAVSSHGHSYNKMLPDSIFSHYLQYQRIPGSNLAVKSHWKFLVLPLFWLACSREGVLWLWITGWAIPCCKCVRADLASLGHHSEQLRIAQGCSQKLWLQNQSGKEHQISHVNEVKAAFPKPL